MTVPPEGTPSGERFPYDAIAAEQRWDRAVTDTPLDELDPQGATRFTFDRSTKFASAGSCFAQRVADSLRASPYRYLQAEPGPAWLDERQRTAYNYAPLPARYGNVYTSLQLLQLLRRACGTFVPDEDAWALDDGGFADPFRPRIQPGGFETVELLRRDRTFHLAAVQRMFRELDAFVFTLGLTECWTARSDGAVFPACPGRGIGRFDDARYEFRNLGVAENVEALTDFLRELRAINPSAKVIFSVSPVAVAATLDAPHVVRASVYSKSVLRAAAETVVRNDPATEYFASFELFSYGRAAASWFEPDGRHVTAAGIERVMRMFYRHFLNADVPPPRDAASSAPRAPSAEVTPCDEDLLLGLLR
ncbi:MAG: GSCFA domain-containing protein [Candidatus Eremiobacteraeota bacterium]|nr:GSCFA domain-containing protein [Candidatus Eremiobacteraeota bacterium]